MWDIRLSTGAVVCLVLCKAALVAAETPHARLAWQGRTAPEWIERLRSDTPAERADAVLSLGYIARLSRHVYRKTAGEKGISLPRPGTLAGPLLVALNDDDGVVRRFAASALGYAEAGGPEQEGRIRDALGRRLRADDDGAVRANAVGALYQRTQAVRGRRPGDMMDLLKAATRDSDARVRRRLARVPRAYDWQPDQLEALLRTLLKDADPFTCYRALQTARRVSRARNALQPEIIGWMKRKGNPRPHDTLSVVIRSGWKNETCLEPLGEAIMVHEDGMFFLAAFEQLGKCGAAAVPVLRKCLTKPRVQRLALKALRRIGPAAAAARQEVRELAESADRKVAAEASRLLGELPVEPESGGGE